MPTYEYECKSCGHSFDVFQSMKDPPLKDCPQCGREVRRVINGGGGIIFKGSGFYVTDKKGGTSSANSKAPAKPDSGGEKSALPAAETAKGGKEHTPAAKGGEVSEKKAAG